MGQQYKQPQQQYRQIQPSQPVQPAKRTCPVCSRVVGPELSNCPACGYVLKKKEPSSAVPSSVVREKGGEGKNCPVCSSWVTGDVCHRCGFTVRKKDEEITSTPPKREESRIQETRPIEREAPRAIEERWEKVPLGELRKVDVELEKFLADKVEALKKVRAEIFEEEKRLTLKKLKIEARIRIFEDQKQKLIALLDTMDAEIKAKKRALEEEEMKLKKMSGEASS